MTPPVVRAAVRLVRSGTAVDPGRVLDEETPRFPGRYWHQPVDVTPPWTSLRSRDSAGEGGGKNAINRIAAIQVGTFQTDTFQVGTQQDSIGHIRIGDRFYDGWTTRDGVAGWGLRKFGMETIPPSVTRGVLIGLAADKGVERLPKGYVITIADSESALARHGAARTRPCGGQTRQECAAQSRSKR